MDRVIKISLLLGSIACYTAGVFYPIMSTKYQVVGLTLKTQDINLLDSIKLFFESGDYLLALIILVFTLVFPILKYIELLLGITCKKIHLKKAIELDKWNMLDVFIVAMLLLNFKMNSSFIVMELRIGTTFLAISVILRILLGALMHKTKESAVSL